RADARVPLEELGHGPSRKGAEAVSLAARAQRREKGLAVFAQEHQLGGGRRLFQDLQERVSRFFMEPLRPQDEQDPPASAGGGEEEFRQSVARRLDQDPPGRLPPELVLDRLKVGGLAVSWLACLVGGILLLPGKQDADVGVQQRGNRG